MLKPKILIFTIAYTPHIGGAEIFIQEITKQLKNEFDFTLLTARYEKQLPAEETINGVKIYRLGKGTKWDKFFLPRRIYKKALELHQQKKFALAHGIIANHATLGAMWFTNKTNVPFLLTEQSGDSDFYMWSRMWFAYPWFKKIYNSAKHVHVISKYLKKRVMNFGMPENKISVIPNGIDLKLFNQQFSLVQKNALRKKYNILPQEKIIFTASRLVYKNAIEDLVKAVALLKLTPQISEGLTYKLIIAGNGDREEKIKKLALSLGIQKNIIFLGAIPQKELPKFLSISDVFVRPSISEGLGNSFLEAMAAGIPIIGTKVGGIPDFLIDGKTGLFCKVHNPQDLTKKIQQICEDKKLIKKLSKNGKELAKNYSWDKINLQIKLLFKAHKKC